MSILVAPAIDGTRSGRDLVQAVDRSIGPSGELGFVAWPEQFLLQWPRAAFHFGFRRPPEEDLRDGIRWVARSGNRQLLLPASSLAPCFDPALASVVGRAHRRDWVLAGRDAISVDCAPDGAAPGQLVHYVPQGSGRLSLAGSGDAAGRVLQGYSEPARGIGSHR
jgi:hypothetical protein